MFKNLVFSKFISKKSDGQKIAIIGLITALNFIANSFLEFKAFDVQLSITILFACLTGIIIGGVSGFFSCVIADFLGYIINSWGYVYMPWVALSTGTFALISGFLFSKNLNKLVLKIVLLISLSFIICTVLINSTGFYFYNKYMGFSTAVLNYVSNLFGSEKVGYIGYLLYRLIFKLQIVNSVFNYVLFILSIPILKRLKVLN